MNFNAEVRDNAYQVVGAVTANQIVQGREMKVNAVIQVMTLMTIREMKNMPLH